MTDTSMYDDAIAAAVAVYDVPAAWILATIGAETSFQSPAPSTWEPTVGEFAYGPMQVLLSTARGLGFAGSAAQLKDPATNIAIGAELLAQLRSSYGDDFQRVYSAYNSGNPDAWTTSSRVAANVARAITWLAQFTGTPAAADTVITPLAIAGVAGLILWWGKKKRS
jgi:soluble lytic murein transglycosylase-like protein